MALSSEDLQPVFADYGNGLYSLYFPFSAAVREELAATFSEDAKARTPPPVVLAAGRSLSDPNNPRTLIHAAFSDVVSGYNHWVLMVNYDATPITRKTTLELSGPRGRVFKMSWKVTYPPNGFWFVWYNPGVGVGEAGVYRLRGSIKGIGEATTHLVAIPALNPAGTDPAN